MHQGENKKQRTLITILFFSIIIIAVAAGLYFLLQYSNQSANKNSVIIENSNINTSSSDSAAVLEDQVTQNYRSTDHGFSVDFPADWQVNTVTTGSGASEIFTLDLFSGEESVGISVMSINQLELLRSSVSIEEESEDSVSGIDAVRLEGSSAKDGSPVDVVYLIQGDKLYSLRGKGDKFETIVSSFSL